MSTWEQWVEISWTEALMVTASTVILYAAIIAYVRIFGLRSFSKLSAFDFAMTIALGTLFAGAISKPDPTIVVSLLALGLLFLCQKLIAVARGNTAFRHLVDNAPLLLVKDGEILEDNLRAANLTHDDLRATLRGANVFRLAQVRAVVFETTADISVLHGGPDDPLDEFLLANVRGRQS